MGFEPPSDEGFSWEPMRRGRFRKGPHQTEAQFKESQKMRKRRRYIKREQEFATFRDTILGNSLNSGLDHYSLWASGRITLQSEYFIVDILKKQKQLRAQGKEWRRVPRHKPHKEVVPPYDFLT